MWHHQLPIHLYSALTFLIAANAAQLPPQYVQSALSHYYHYPTPRHPLTLPRHQHQRLQQQYQSNYISYAQTHQRYVQQQTRPQYQKLPQQQQYRTQSSQPATSYYQSSQHLATSVAQQFAEPALENAAFTTALTNQGYTYGGSRGSNASPSVTSVRALHPSSSASSALTLPLPSSLVEALAAGNDIAAEGAIDSSDASVNLKLPLPINIAPIKVDPLPLQEGASFNALANGVTSYGTVYPQRKR